MSISHLIPPDLVTLYSFACIFFLSKISWECVPHYSSLKIPSQCITIASKHHISIALNLEHIVKCVLKTQIHVSASLR
jgi:hypothetical protein